jgi:uncharacterized protein
VELSHTFTVPASVEDTWAAFGDIGSIAECFPGATVSSVDGDAFSGSCKVKLGPISLTYTGSGTFVDRDEDAHRFVVAAKGKDRRGNGTAGATVTASMTPADADSTEVTVLTDLSITGKPAQFGRGVIQDVSDRLLTQFVDCLAGKVASVPAGAAAEGGSAGRPSGEETPVGEGATEAALAASGDEAGLGHAHPADVAAAQVSAAAEAAAAGVPGATAGGAATARGADAASAGSDDALDLGATVLPALARAYWKPAVAVLLAVLVLRRLLSRRGD